MPTRPLSHEALQRRARATSAAALVQRQAAQHDSHQLRLLKYGKDPRGTVRWQKLRLMVLRREPLCADPYGVHGDRPEPATEVDHIVGVWSDPDAVYDEDNLQPICTACHARKSGMERRRMRE